MVFPFPVHLYNQTYTEADVSANGVVNFTGENLWWANACLPSRIEGASVLLLWDDLLTNGSGQGVFTAELQSPHRFVIQYRTGFVSGGGSANFEVVFTEGSDDIHVIYGAVSQAGANATEGVQAAGDRARSRSSVATRRT